MGREFVLRLDWVWACGDSRTGRWLGLFLFSGTDRLAGNKEGEATDFNDLRHKSDNSVIIKELCIATHVLGKAPLFHHARERDGPLE